MNSQEKLKRGLVNIFGFKKYLSELQQKAVETIWEAKRDVFIRGFGKSLCYQLPVMIKDNAFIIVISCRISYVKIQQNYFKAKNIKTNYLTSNTSRKKKMTIEKDIVSQKSDFKILFITPYQYESGYFKTILKKINKQRLFYIVLDQADNIIVEQENLRRLYQNLDLKIVRVPIIAMSATATIETQKDIIVKFGLLNPKVYAMPVLRSNLYYDTWYINTLPDPLAHLIKFIENCFFSNNDINSVEKENWGLIVCKNLEATISIAKYLTSIGITALPHSSNKKHKHLRNIKDVKVITVCDEVNMLSVTNSLIHIIARKTVRFIVYWYALPNIQKYYLQSSQARYFYGMSYCRVYCELEDLINNCTQSSCLNYESGIKDSLVENQCRHKAYSEYWGDIFSACENYCDICKEKEEVEKKIRLLLQIADDESLEKLEGTLLKLSKNSITICDKNLQYECSKETTVCSEYQSKSIEKDTTKKSNDYQPSLDTSIQYNEENNDEVDKKSQAVLALDEIYKKLYSAHQPTSIFTLTSSQSSNVKMVDSTGRVSIEKSKRSSKRNYETKTGTIEVITIDDENSETEECSVQSRTAQLEKNVYNSDKNDDDIIFIKELRKRRRPSAQDSSLERKKRRK